MSVIELTYLSGADAEALALSDDEILEAVRGYSPPRAGARP